MILTIFISKQKENQTIVGYEKTLQIYEKMEVLQYGATDVFVFGTDILCISRSDFGSNEKVVSLSNFSGEGKIIDLESIFSEKLILILLSTTQDHVIHGEYLTRDFVIYPYEGVTFSFIIE